jgi:hypothetical protein
MAMEREARIATWDDLVSAGRVEVLAPASARSIVVEGRIIPDAEVRLIDLQSSQILGNQTVITDDGLYLAGQISHLSPMWQVHDHPPPDNVGSLRQGSGDGRGGDPPCGRDRADRFVYFLLNGSVGCVSFGHFVFDLLSQLLAWDEVKRPLRRRGRTGPDQRL